MTSPAIRQRAPVAHRPGWVRTWRPALSFIALGAFVLLLWPLLDWALFDAYWTGSGGTVCPDKSGACWPFIAERLGQLVYGSYPTAERWRVDLGLAIGLLLILPIMLPRLPRKALFVALFVAVYPPIVILLFSGGAFGLAPVRAHLDVG